MSLTGMVHLEEYRAAEGELTLRVQTEEDDKMCALLLESVFQTVMAGLAAVEEEYPEYVYIA